MIKFGKYHWISLFVLIFVLFLGAMRATKPKVLVLYATSKTSVVTKYLKSGIDEVLAENRVPVSVRQHYMDLDTNLTAEQLGREVNEALGMVQHYTPDVIIISGHEANTLLAPKILEQGVQPWIVPIAVEAEPAALGYKDVTKVIGVIRKLPILGIADFMDNIEGRKTERVSVLGADSPGNQLRMKNLSQGAIGKLHVSSHLLSNCFADWQKYVTQQTKVSDVVLILPTDKLQERCNSESPVLVADQFIPWLEAHSAALPIGTNGSFVKNGGAVSFYPSYNEEGALAMRLALDLINPNRLQVPPQIETDSYQVALDAKRLKARNLSVPSIYMQYGQKSGLNYRDSD